MLQVANRLCWKVVVRGWGLMALLSNVRDAGGVGIRFVIVGTVDGLKQRSFTVAVAVDQVRWIRRETGMGRIDRVYGVEVISWIVDMNSDTRPMSKLLMKSLFIGMGRGEKCQGCEY